MTSRVTYKSELLIHYAADGRRGSVRPPAEVSWQVAGPVQYGDLAGKSKLLLAVPSAETRLFLMLYPTGATTMTVLWNGLDTIPIPSLFVTTDDGYEVSAGGVVTPITVTNPTSGTYRFWRGETPADFNSYPGGIDNSITTIPDTEVY